MLMQQLLGCQVENVAGVETIYSVCVTANEAFRKNLRKLLENEKQIAIAEEGGFSQQYLSALSTGRKPNPTLRVVQRVAAALGKTVAELLAEPGSPKPEPPEEAYINSKEAELCRMLRAILDHGDPEAGWIAGNILTFFNQVTATREKPSKKGRRATSNGRKRKTA